jgi:DNA-directed RNA polymerase specialized sigma24 family protein
LSPWDKKVRDVVIYTYFDGYKQEEIAELTGMGESTIRRHLTTFKRKCSQSGIQMEDLL